jgi:hypothetical protein
VAGLNIAEYSSSVACSSTSCFFVGLSGSLSSVSVECTLPQQVSFSEDALVCDCAAGVAGRLCVELQLAREEDQLAAGVRLYDSSMRDEFD